MGLKLLSHVNADGDLIEAWIKYYLRLGVEEFHIVLHGPAEENKTLLDISSSYPIEIHDRYEGPFESEQKKRRLDALLARFRNQWVLVVDSDEFVEFPYRDISTTIKKLEFAKANVLVAPMLQRLKHDGTLDTPPTIDDPFETFPLCSEDLYQRMGSNACIQKCPLFYCGPETSLYEEGNHSPPRGDEVRMTAMLGVTHHFKFRQTLAERLHRRINSEYTFRHESVQFQEYLDEHGIRLPLEGAFRYSREELWRRRLLRKLSLRNCARSFGRMFGL